MKRAALIGAAYIFITASAHGAERTLGGDEIKSFLPEIAARGGNTYQTFEASGRTEYFSGGRQSEGRWEVRDDKYCSVWPPQNDWVCYAVIIDESEKQIFWVVASGDREKNRYEPRN